jgi:ferredoxin-NADP reductase
MTEADLELVVTRRETATDDVVALELTNSREEPLPSWTAGSHIDLVLTDSLVRQYSLCGDVDGAYRIGVLLEADGRGGSAYVHDKLWPGVTVTARGPRNRFALEPADRYVFIAGGIGITPILPMLAQASSQGADWQLHYGGRTASAMAFAENLVRRYGTQVRLYPQDQAGLIDVESTMDAVDESTLVYCCGPAPLIDTVERACGRRAPGRLRIERFAANPSEPVLVGQDRPFTVEIASTGQAVDVGSDESLLAALERAGIDVSSSCQDGVCGTCQVNVLGGLVDHRDAVLTQEERDAQDRMQVCVSRSRGTRLVLDL